MICYCWQLSGNLSKMVLFLKCQHWVSKNPACWFKKILQNCAFRETLRDYNCFFEPIILFVSQKIQIQSTNWEPQLLTKISTSFPASWRWTCLAIVFCQVSWNAYCLASSRVFWGSENNNGKVQNGVLDKHRFFIVCFWGGLGSFFL